MAKELHGKELGVEGCDYVAEGSPNEIVQRFVDHLRAEHEIDMPEVERILEGKVGEGDVAEGGISRGAWIVTQRLQERLDLLPKGSGKPWPPAG